MAHDSTPNPQLATILEAIQNRDYPDSIEQIKAYVAMLETEECFYPARQLLSQAREKYRSIRQFQSESTAVNWWQTDAAQDEVWITQKQAFFTYKNPELPPRTRFIDSLLLLEEIGLRDSTNRNAETLALGGSIYKRKWQHFGQLEDLIEALFFYRAAFERNPQQDKGYGGANAALILDILADRAKQITRRSGIKLNESEASIFSAQAAAIRQNMVLQIPVWQTELEQLPESGYFWPQVTFAEIYFGLQQYDKAKEWLQKANVVHAINWKKQTIFSQLLQIAHLHGLAIPNESDQPENWLPAWQTLALIIDEESARRAFLSGTGKVGLSLSGGGFRASFFHLGVMARLAEIDALRGIEALSTVSGGSIVGAHYYLEVQKLLESKPDKAITRNDYIEIVRRVQDNFLKGVQTNIKMQTFASLTDNLDVFFRKKHYSRSHRLGELYESEIYQSVDDGHANHIPRTMPELLIMPEGKADIQTHKPKHYNWLRRAKIPALVINSTSLNSGHNWQFTARSMGEPPSQIDGEIDNNTRYRRMYYEHTPNETLQKYRLGYAVAASACVPGLFEPLTIADLYQDKIVRLVDGGVHDNQGVAGLLDEGCTRILCSDACGQMDDDDMPSDSPPGVVLRASSILQDRVREAEYQDLSSRLDSHALDGLFFVHTKKELESQPLDWINCQDPRISVQPQDHKTSYGIDRELQKKIAGIRTDLDAFTEVEAYAIMASGYRIAKRELELLQMQHQKVGYTDYWGGYDIDAPETDWPFRKLEPIMALKTDANKQSQDLHFQLHVARKVFFKIYDLRIDYRIIVWTLLALLIAGILTFLYQQWSTPLTDTLHLGSLTWGKLFSLFIVILISALIPMVHLLSPSNKATNIIKFLVATVGSLLAKFHLAVVDRWFLRRGKLERLLKLK